MHNKNTFNHCFYKSNDGVKLHYLSREGSNKHACCLLLHGFTNDAHIFDYLADELNDNDMTVIALDFRGHGDSQWDQEANYSHEQLIDDVLVLLQQHNFKEWHIIGHSLGARVAMLLMAQHNFQPKTLTIIDTGPEVRAIGVKKVRQDAENTPAIFAHTNQFFDYLSTIYFLAKAERLRHVASHGLKYHQGQLIAKTDPAFTRALWQQDNDQAENSGLRAPKQHDLWLAIESIKCPCLIIRGQASAILSQTVAEKMLNKLEKGKLTVIPRSGHALILDNPSDFEQATLEFIEEHSG